MIKLDCCRRGCKGQSLCLLAAVLFPVYLTGGCSKTVFKSGALNLALLEENEERGALIHREGPFVELEKPGVEWLADVDPLRQLVFASYRDPSKAAQYAAVAAIKPEDLDLVLLPLKDGESPLDVLSSEQRKQELKTRIAAFHDSPESKKIPVITLPLGEVFAGNILLPPLPVPNRIYAVAANYPSHLRFDLGIEEPQRYRAALSGARARVFVKYPPVPPPSADIEIPSEQRLAFAQLLGAFDTVLYPRRVWIPGVGTAWLETDARLDYEVELGVVIGQDLRWQDVKDASDSELEEAVVGSILVGDTKFRNPQVMDRIVHFGQMPRAGNPYRIGHAYLDRRFGVWNEQVCAWWSYAASWGRFTSLGPFLVESTEPEEKYQRALLSARTYSPEPARAFPAPAGVELGQLYLTQASASRADSPDMLYWDVADIIRSILAPGTAIPFGEQQPLIRKGDVILLGTPGGTTISARSGPLIEFVKWLLFWWTPQDWHDMFFRQSEQQYLYEGDELFYWGQNLGFQYLYLKAFP